MVSTNDPLVSIVTPVYNAERFITDTIETVLAQSYNNWELILVDDNSSDSSVKIIKSYQKKDSRIKLFDHGGKNLGAALSRNKGIDEAKGRFIAFLDADDLWDKDKLIKQVEFSDNGKRPFVYSSYKFANEAGKPVSKSVIVPKTINYRESLKNHIIWTSTVLIDLDKIPRGLLEMPNVKRGQDAATWWKILGATGISAHGIQKPLALYRRSNNSLSSNKLKAIQRTWYLYRHVEKLSLLQSVYYFVFYAFNAVKKRV